MTCEIVIKTKFSLCRLTGRDRTNEISVQRLHLPCQTGWEWKHCDMVIFGRVYESRVAVMYIQLQRSNKHLSAWLSRWRVLPCVYKLDFATPDAWFKWFPSSRSISELRGYLWFTFRSVQVSARYKAMLQSQRFVGFCFTLKFNLLVKSALFLLGSVCAMAILDWISCVHPASFFLIWRSGDRAPW